MYLIISYSGQDGRNGTIEIPFQPENFNIEKGGRLTSYHVNQPKNNERLRNTDGIVSKITLIFTQMTCFCLSYIL